MSKAFRQIPSLGEYVLKKTDKDEAELQEASEKWLTAWSRNKLSYEIEWLGIPVIQSPEDLILMQELIFKLRPDFIVETGVAHGGSLIYYSSLFEILGNGHIIGIDIDIRKHNRQVIEQHPMFKRISLIQGSSTDPEIFNQVKKQTASSGNILVCLDSDHTYQHVLNELRIYSALVPVGGYLVVFDTFTEFVAQAGAADARYIDNGPMRAVNEFIQENPAFEVDAHYDRLRISSSPRGYLKRIA